MSRLQVTGLDRTFAGRAPVRALAGVTVAVESGRLLAVLGPSGCGKTTLLRTVAGMDRPDAGTVQLGERILEGPGVHVTPEHRAIGLVPQEGALFPHLDVARNIGPATKRAAAAAWASSNRPTIPNSFIAPLPMTGAHRRRLLHEF